MARNASRPDRPAAGEEWEAYACRIPAPGDSRFDRSACSTLSQVYHVAHVADACRIIEDGRIKAGLIGDDSRLRRTRTSVCWLSANYWTPGSIYGAIQFTFRWEDIIRDREFYWVEVMDYPNPAYRFLITDRDLSGASLLRPYDPATARGPALAERRLVLEWRVHFRIHARYGPSPQALRGDQRYPASRRPLPALPIKLFRRGP